MKKSILYFILAAVALLATACEKDSLLEGYEGSVSLSVEMPSATTRAEETTTNPDAVKVRIYRGDGVTLIRRYTSLDEIPNPLYLVAGDYVIKAEGGDVNNTAFVKPKADTEAKALELLRKKLCYMGEETLNVVAKQNSNCNIVCKTINTQLNVNFDATDAANDATKRQKYENRMLRNVKVTVAALDWAKIEDSNEDSKITVDEFKAAVTKQKAPKLEFKFTGDEYDKENAVYNSIGYYIMPENAANTLVWAFEATHVGDEANGSPADGPVAQVGKMTNIKAGYGYTVDFCYSRTPDGYTGIDILVDNTVETIEQTIFFKPQPTISGEGIGEGENVYKFGGNGLSLKCESINALKSIKIGGVEFFGGDGEVIAGAIAGITAEKKSETLVEFTISDEYIKTLSGASQTLAFEMKDASGEDVFTQDIKIKKRGLMLDEITPDLWANTAEFKAFVPEDGVADVKIQFRKKGTSEWIPLTAEAKGDNVYSKTSSPVWNKVDDRDAGAAEPLWVYTPDTDKSIFANSEYECQLLIGGAVVDEGILNTATTQTIENADFNSSSMPCFGTSTNDTSFWDSGNNDMASSLCTYDSNFKCVKLTANDPGMGMMGAGNIFTGQFRMSGTKGTVHFGKYYDWKARPTSLNLEYLAKIYNVTHTKHAAILEKGTPDEASIYVAIIDWDDAHQVSSGTDTPEGVWSPKGSPDPVDNKGKKVGKIIGYGVYYPTGVMTDAGLVSKQIPIYYYNPEDAKPSKNLTLIIAASTSRYGDYMNGCASSDEAKNNVMWVDNFHWGYSDNVYDK